MRGILHLVSVLAWMSGLKTDVKEHKTNLVIAGIVGHLLTELVVWNTPHQRRLS
ncbi:MAG: hypothetical protein UBAL2_86920228 [Leptospirillum rubarum]|nr:MAG: hypothetical protein UBAL2_86920228 [Leptospirillum rubarum]